MAKNYVSNPFLFPSNFPSYPSDSTTPPSSPSSRPPFFSSQSTSSLESPYKSSPSPPRNLHSRSSSSHLLPPAAFGPCAACTFHNRKCSENCYLASFLPPNEVHKLAVVESVFGSGNVDNFLQRNGNSAYIPLLLLLKDTTQEDEELNFDHKNNGLSETEVNNEVGVCVSLKKEFNDRDLFQESKVHLNSLFSSDTNREELVHNISSSFETSLSILYWSELQNSAALIDADTDSNDPESPNYTCHSPGACSANFDGLSLESSKKRKLQPTQVTSSDRMEGNMSSYLQRKNQGFVGKSRLNR